MSMNKKMFSGAAGLIFIILGIMGLFMHDIFGVLHVDQTHNVIHLAVGLAGIWSALGETSAKVYTRLFGIFFFLLGAIGFFVPDLFGMMAMKLSDHIFHLLVGVCGLYFGFASNVAERPKSMPVKSMTTISESDSQSK